MSGKSHLFFRLPGCVQAGKMGAVLTNPPPDVPEENFRAFAEQFEYRAQKLGLYLEESGLHFHAEEGPDPDQPPVIHGPYIFAAKLRIGAHAFSQDVQDPEGAATDIAFGAIIEGEAQSEFDQIRDSYLRKDKDDQEQGEDGSTPDA